MQTVFHASLESRNFSFAAIGLTKAKAIEALVKGLNKHTEVLNLDPDWYSIDGDIGVTEMKIDAAYRDHSEIDLNN